MTEERETQFLTVLLVCGGVPNLRGCLDFNNRTAQNNSVHVAGELLASAASFKRFKIHRTNLIVHLMAADYFDVYHCVTCANEKNLKQLTEKATLWIGEFYQWLLAKQEAA